MVCVCAWCGVPGQEIVGQTGKFGLDTSCTYAMRLGDVFSTSDGSLTLTGFGADSGATEAMCNGAELEAIKAPKAPKVAKAKAKTAKTAKTTKNPKVSKAKAKANSDSATTHTAPPSDTVDDSKYMAVSLGAVGVVGAMFAVLCFSLGVALLRSKKTKNSDFVNKNSFTDFVSSGGNPTKQLDFDDATTNLTTDSDPSTQNSVLPSGLNMATNLMHRAQNNFGGGACADATNETAIRKSELGAVIEADKDKTTVAQTAPAAAGARRGL